MEDVQWFLPAPLVVIVRARTETEIDVGIEIPHQKCRSPERILLEIDAAILYLLQVFDRACSSTAEQRTHNPQVVGSKPTRPTHESPSFKSSEGLFLLLIDKLSIVK